MSLYMCDMCHANVATFTSEVGRYCSFCNSIMEFRDDTLDNRLTTMREKIDHQEEKISIQYELLMRTRTMLTDVRLGAITYTTFLRQAEAWLADAKEVLKL